MESLEHYKTRVDHAIEVGLVDYKVNDAKIFDILQEAFKAPGETAKLGLLLSAIKQALPKSVSQKIQEKLRVDYDRELPYRSEMFDFRGKVGQGGESRVFLLEARDENLPSFVIKINYAKNGSTEDIIEKAKNSVSEHKEASSDYEEIEGFIPEEFHIVIKNPKNKKPALAIFQKFIGGKINDVFEDFSVEELSEIVNNDIELKEKFLKFMNILTSKWETEGVALDLAGKANLCLVENNGKYELIYLDPHNPSIKGFDPKEREDKIEKCIQFLKKVESLIK